MNTIIEPIKKKLAEKRRLDFQEALFLYESVDLLQLGKLAEEVTLENHGLNVYYSINQHINYTNICRIHCDFCGFSRQPGQEGGYVLTAEEIIDHVSSVNKQGIDEIHLVGGIHPDLPFEYYINLIEGIHKVCPDVYIKAFTAVEIIDLAQKSGKSIETTLNSLRNVGLSALPGGGAEILDDAYFTRYCRGKSMPDEWLDVHARAHHIGLMSNATMLYGYKETPADRIRHMLKLRTLQDESLKNRQGSFLCFIPLPYINPDRAGTGQAKFDIISDLKTISLSRLILDNFPNIKAFWPMLGLKTAQVALCFGANDLDGTVGRYQIVEDLQHGAGRKQIKGVSEKQLCTLIKQAQRIPARRKGLTYR
ncbi:MAG: CofH family radical SAM protein [Sedimentisphaerales bacterium]|nr:CofH family radical SAM protein [Sedimentisphaerales bacterium]